MLNEAERSRGLSVLASLETLKPQATRIQTCRTSAPTLMPEVDYHEDVEFVNLCDSALPNCSRF